MARRKTLIDEARAKGPVLVLDTGNALYRIPGNPDPAAKERATFILKTMAQLGTAALAAGARDLSEGADVLREQARKAGLKVLSANLVDTGKKRVFPASTVVTTGGVRVGLIGLTAAGVSGADPPVAAGLAEAKRLRTQCDVVIVLAATSFADALQLATQAGDTVDFILQSSESRPPGYPQRQDKAFVVPSGERGRGVGRLDLIVSGKGAFADLTEVARNRQTLTLLEARIAEAKQHATSIADGGMGDQGWAQSLASLEQRHHEVEAQVQAGSKPAPRSFSLDYANLGRELADDPSLQAAVAKIEPPH
jgi:2',3'-cyclic-nucleotide 2'-phosphodiesterase (5'-nucleotidase family)